MRLKEILKEKGVSGSELARRLGVSPAYINYACSGKVNLSVNKCEEVAQALGVTVSSLFDDYVEPGIILCPHCGQPLKIVKG